MRRNSLVPPPEKKVTWDEYIKSDVNNYPRLGRDLVYKESSKSFKATIAMVRQQYHESEANCLFLNKTEFKYVKIGF